MWHPDRHMNDERLRVLAHEKVKAINDAFEQIRSAHFPPKELLRRANNHDSHQGTTDSSSAAQHPRTQTAPPAPQRSDTSRATTQKQNAFGPHRSRGPRSEDLPAMGRVAVLVGVACLVYAAFADSWWSDGTRFSAGLRSFTICVDSGCATYAYGLLVRDATWEVAFIWSGRAVFVLALITGGLAALTAVPPWTRRYAGYAGGSAIAAGVSGLTFVLLAPRGLESASLDVGLLAFAIGVVATAGTPFALGRR